MIRTIYKFIRTVFASFLVLGLLAAPCFAEVYVNEEYGVHFTIPDGCPWSTDEQKTTGPDGGVTTLLGFCRIELPPTSEAEAVNAFILLAVYDYPEGGPQEGLDLEGYVKASLTPAQKLVSDLEAVSVGGFEGIQYVLEETDPARYGTAKSLITLIRTDKRRIIEFTASTNPAKYFDAELDNFKMAFYGLQVKKKGK